MENIDLPEKTLLPASREVFANLIEEHLSYMESIVDLGEEGCADFELARMLVDHLVEEIEHTASILFGEYFEVDTNDLRRLVASKVRGLLISLQGNVDSWRGLLIHQPAPDYNEVIHSIYEGESTRARDVLSWARNTARAARESGLEGGEFYYKISQGGGIEVGPLIMLHSRKIKDPKLV